MWNPNNCTGAISLTYSSSNWLPDEAVLLWVTNLNGPTKKSRLLKRTLLNPSISAFFTWTPSLLHYTCCPHDSFSSRAPYSTRIGDFGGGRLSAVPSNQLHFYFAATKIATSTTHRRRVAAVVGAQEMHRKFNFKVSETIDGSAVIIIGSLDRQTKSQLVSC